MNDIIWVISEDKRKLFDEKYQVIIKAAPKQIWENVDYMPYWFSELPFPSFNKGFIENLPNNYRQEIRNLFDQIVLDK